MKKRLLSMLLCVAMCLSVMHVPAYAEESTENEPEKTKETSKDTSEKEDSDYETVKIMIDNRNWGIAPSCSFYINGIEVWRGRIGDTAELKLKGKTKVRFKSFGIPLVILYGEFEGEIDPAAGKKYVLKYKGKNKHKIQFALSPAEFF